MPTDVTVEIAHQGARALSGRRLPIGFGLGLGACASVALWTFLGFGVRALLS